MTPLDVVKIRMQSQGIITENKCFIYCNGLMEHLCTCAAVDSPVKSGAQLPWYKKPGNFVGTRVRPFPVHEHPNPTCIYHSDSAISARLTAAPRSVRISIRMSPLDALFKIVRNEGVLSLWSGLSPTLVMALPQTVIYYSLNDWLKDWIGYSSKQFNAAFTRGEDNRFLANDCTPALIGGFSRIFAVTAISPLELLRTKMQAIKQKQMSPARSVLAAVKHDGIQSLWTGVGPTLLRDVPYSMIFWFVFDYFKSRHLISQLTPSDYITPTFHGLGELRFHQTFLYGALAGLTAGVLTHPFDVIKTHRQIQLGQSWVTGRTYSRSTWISLHQLYQSKGLQALYAGFTPRLVKTTNASAIMISTFELLKKYFIFVPE